MVFTPQTEGDVAIRTPATEFARGLQRRVDAGLLTGSRHPRSKYTCVELAPGQLEIRAAGWLTAINVGLNEVHVGLEGAGFAHYTVRYWRWAAFTLSLSGTMGLVGVALLLTLDVRGYIARNFDSMVPGLSVDQNLLIAWAMAIFWGFVWPWVLIALHKGPLRRLVERIFREVDSTGASA